MIVETKSYEQSNQQTNVQTKTSKSIIEKCAATSFIIYVDW